MKDPARSVESSHRTGQPKSGMRELMALPILMGGLSLLMWFSLPTKQQVRGEYAAQIEQRELELRRVAADVPASGRARDSYCQSTLDPLPVRLRDEEYATNTDIITASDLNELSIPNPLRGDREFYLRGTLTLLMYWRHFPPGGRTQRMGRDRIDEEIIQPLATRYFVLYGVEELATSNALRVDAFVYDLPSGRRLCEFRALYQESPRPAERFLTDLATLTGGTFSNEWFR